MTLRDTPSGDCDVVSFEILGQPFQAISAGPLFTFNPSISFMVNFDPTQQPDAKNALDAAWAKLVDGGKVLMPLGAYPFSEHYGWVQDRYGVSWQLILTKPEGEERPEVLPTLLFVGDAYGRAEEAVTHYLATFSSEARPGAMMHYGPGQEPHRAGTVMFSDVKLADCWMVAMDGGGDHSFAFNEAISFLVSCDTQAEIDALWSKLSAVPEAEQCGWLKDRFGVSWQIVPRRMKEMMRSGDEAAIKRVTAAFLTMKKFDVAVLEAAFVG